MTNTVEQLPHTSVRPSSLVINWIGLAGFLFKTTSGQVLCVDPYLSNCMERDLGVEARRMWWPTFAFDRFKVDAVICTHDHIDHTDPDTIPLISAYNPSCVFYGPKTSCDHMQKMNIPTSRIFTMATGREYVVGNMVFKSVYARHTEDSIGLILQTAGITLYITGDTGLCDEIFRMSEERPHVLITCINGLYGNLNAEEALLLAKRIGVKIAIPMHYGLIPMNTVKPETFADLCARNGLVCCLMATEKNYALAKDELGRISFSTQ